MIITHIGHSCFKLQDKLGPEGVTVTTDPFDKTIGLKVPNFESDIVTISHDHPDHNNASALRGDPFVIKTPGEYEVKGVMVQGISTKHDEKNGSERGENVIFRIEIDDIVVGHLGDLGHALSDEQLEEFSEIDILLIPVGGNYTIDAKKAVEVISQIEPRIIIPMHYKTKELKIDIEAVDKFVKEIGIEPQEEEKLKINKKDLPQEGMELIILKSV